MSEYFPQFLAEILSFEVLQPFCINLAPKILDLLNVENRDFAFANAENSLQVKHKINEPKALFPRLQIKEI